MTMKYVILLFVLLATAGCIDNEENRTKLLEDFNKACTGNIVGELKLSDWGDHIILKCNYK